MNKIIICIGNGRDGTYSLKENLKNICKINNSSISVIFILGKIPCFLQYLNFQPTSYHDLTFLLSSKQKAKICNYTIKFIFNC
jgi:hypothetical protein